MLFFETCKDTSLRGQHGHETAVANRGALLDANRVNARAISTALVIVIAAFAATICVAFIIAAATAAIGSPHGANGVNVHVARARTVDECDTGQKWTVRGQMA